MKKLTKCCFIFFTLTFLHYGGFAMPHFSTPAVSLNNLNENFAFKLYQQLDKEEKNLFFSPYSILSVLYMIYTGSDNNTLKEFQKALVFPLANQEFLKEFENSLAIMQKIQEKKDLEINSSNSIWAQKTEPFLSSYLEVLKKFFNTTLYDVDFNQHEAVRKKINSLVEKETKNRIQNLIPQGVLSALTRMVLVNAIYFKAQWKYAFSKNSTLVEDFYCTPNEKVKTPFMHQKGNFLYAENKDVQFLELPYQGNDLSFLVFLPKPHVSFSNTKNISFLRELQNLASLGHFKQVRVFLPSFKLETSFELSNTLQTLGVKDAFDLKADFSKMNGKRNLFLSALIHKAFVEVNEEGTEAAAATAGIMTMKSAAIQPKPITEFKANRPFIFMIQEKSTGLILFLGKIAKPTL